MKFISALILALACAANAAAYDASALGALRVSAPGAGLRGLAAVPPVRAERVYAAAYRHNSVDMLAGSRPFMGLPYVLGPLGEGPGAEFDRGPLVSYSGLDCTTFVEQAMAFALGNSEAEALDLLRLIRYRGGNISYENRNHFTELDWLPNNIAAGFLRDITAEIAGSEARSAAKTISKRAWYAAKTEADLDGFDWEAPEARAARAARLRALGAGLPDQRATVNYVPLEALPRLLARIPHGTVVSIVREDQPDKPTLVSHQLLIIDGGRGKIIRHAAQGRQVLDTDAAQYIAGLSGAKWRVLGFNLAQVLPR
ncbi:MAG: hypothetical protein A2X29_12000 [Elusimicrobia bacterium GWA2_64_40]|nr:MAG: hypothetical protein A2X29_12000 [Elusimicrobia bacterium GWA2_64_40]